MHGFLGVSDAGIDILRLPLELDHLAELLALVGLLVLDAGLDGAVESGLVPGSQAQEPEPGHRARGREPPATDEEGAQSRQEEDPRHQGGHLQLRLARCQGVTAARREVAHRLDVLDQAVKSVAAQPLR